MHLVALVGLLTFCGVHFGMPQQFALLPCVLHWLLRASFSAFCFHACWLGRAAYPGRMQPVCCSYGGMAQPCTEPMPRLPPICKTFACL